MKDLQKIALNRGVQKIYPSKEALHQRLASPEPLKIYQGFDPTAPTLHIGHMTGLRKLRQFQDLGHHIIFLVGDFTALIGDPSEKSETRPRLTRARIKENLRLYKKQAGLILDFDRKENPVQIRMNSTWTDRLSPEDLLGLASQFTVQQLIERDMFQDRLKRGKPIAVSEFLYPLFQGYDSVAMDVDMEIGATDQTFNMLAGRTLVRAMRQKEKFVLTTKLLQSSSGKKMGKSEGNMIELSETPENMYGKIMALPDDFLKSLIELLTDFPIPTSIDDPMGQKKRVAHDVVRQIHGERAADRAADEFARVIQGRGVPTKKEPLPLARTLTVLATVVATGVSAAEAKRLLQQGGVRYNGEVLTVPNETLHHRTGSILKIGKRRWYAIRVKERA